MVYLYCITNAAAASLDFLSLNKIQLIEFGSFTVVAADPPDFEPASPNCIMRHFDINDRILRKGFTVLPFAYGTVVSLEDVRSFVGERRESILHYLEKFKEKVEMGIKILVMNKKDQFAKELFDRLGDTPGHRFLSKRLEKYSSLFAVSDIAKNLRSDIENCLGSSCTGIKIKNINGNVNLISMALLIKRDSINKFFSVLKLIESAYSDCKFLISGPWPAYNFINLKGK